MIKKTVIRTKPIEDLKFGALRLIFEILYDLVVITVLMVLLNPCNLEHDCSWSHHIQVPGMFGFAFTISQ